MTRDAKESLVALAAVLYVFGAFWLMSIYPWVPPFVVGLSLSILLGFIVRWRNHRLKEEPE